MIKIDKDALKKNILKIRYNNRRKLHNKYLHDDMIISNNMKNSILKILILINYRKTNIMYILFK